MDAATTYIDFVAMTHPWFDAANRGACTFAQ
jgi:hypothetical protein